MKALEILNLYHTHGEDIMFVPFKKYYVEEAIAELEALDRCCDGCKHASRPADREPCNRCKRLNEEDNWEAK